MIEEFERRRKVADIRRISGKSHECYELEGEYMELEVVTETELPELGLVVDKDELNLYEVYTELYCASCNNSPTYDRVEDEWYCPACE